jgi:hypothetical protein
MHGVVAARESRLGDLAPQAVGPQRPVGTRVPRPARDRERERDAEVGMQQTVEPDAGARAQDAAQQLVAEVAAHEAIAVMHEHADAPAPRP